MPSKSIRSALALALCSALLCAQVPGSVPPAVQRHLNQAQIYLDQEKYTEVVRELRAAIALWPQIPGAYYQLGLGLFHLGDFAAAENAFQKELGFGAPDPYSLYYLGRIRLQAGQRRQAVAFFERSLAAGEVRNVRQRLGASYLALNRIDQAIGFLEASVKNHPADGNLHYLLARAYKAKGRTGDAAREFDTAAKLKTKTNTESQALTALAEALASNDEARTTAVGAELLQLSNADVLVAAGTMFGQAGRHRDALPFLEKSISVNARSAEAHYNLGRAYVSLGQQDKAVKALRLVTELNPAFYEAQVLLGTILSSSGQSEAAIRHLRAAAEIRNDNPRLLMMLGLQYFGQRYYSDAAVVLTRAVQLSPGDPDPRFLLIQACFRDLQYERALALAKEARDKFPDNGLARFHLAAQLSNFNRLDEAQAELEAALSRDPGLTEARIVLGDVLFRMGKAAESLVEMRRALADDRTLMNAHAGVGRALIQMRNFAEAAAAMEQAIQIDSKVAALHLYLSLPVRAGGGPVAAPRQADIFSRLNQERAQARDQDVERKYPGLQGANE